MDKEDIIGTPKKALKDCLSRFDTSIKNALMGMDYETALVFMDKFSHKLDGLVVSLEHDIYCRKLVNSIKK